MRKYILAIPQVDMRYFFIVFLFTAQVGFAQSSGSLLEAKDAFEQEDFDQAKKALEELKS